MIKDRGKYIAMKNKANSVSDYAGQIPPKKNLKFYCLFVLKKIFWEPPKKLNTYQIHAWAVIFGILGGILAVAYGYVLNCTAWLFWNIIPTAIRFVFSNENLFIKAKIIPL